MCWFLYLLFGGHSAILFKKWKHFWHVDWGFIVCFCCKTYGHNCPFFFAKSLFKCSYMLLHLRIIYLQMMATKSESHIFFVWKLLNKQRILLYFILLSLWAPSKLLNAYAHAHSFKLKQLFLHFLFKLLNDFLVQLEWGGYMKGVTNYKNISFYFFMEIFSSV